MPHATVAQFSCDARNSSSAQCRRDLDGHREQAERHPVRGDDDRPHVAPAQARPVHHRPEPARRARAWVEVPHALRARRDRRGPAAVGHQLPVATGRSGGGRRAAGLLPLRRGQPRRSTSTRGCSSWASGWTRSTTSSCRTCTSTTPATCRCSRTRTRSWSATTRRRTSRSTSTALFTGAHLKTDYEGLNFETVSGDTEFLPGVTLIETPGPHPRLHVDAGRPARHRHDDLHVGRGLHGRQLRPARHAGRHRQQPRGVVLLGGEAARHPGADRTRRWSSGTTPSRSSSCAWPRRSRTHDRRRSAHRGDDLHLGGAAAEVRCRGRPTRSGSTCPGTA